MFSGRAAPAGFVVPSGTRARSPGIHSWVSGRCQRLREDGIRSALSAVDVLVGRRPGLRRPRLKPWGYLRLSLKGRFR